MSKQLFTATWLALAVVATAPVAFSQDPAAATTATMASKTADEIRECSRDNLPDKTMVQDVNLQSTDRLGKTKDIRAVFYIKRFDKDETRTTLQVRAPVNVSGVSYLWVDSDDSDRLYLYLPSLQRVRRVSGKAVSESMLGTDFSHEDVKHLRSVSAGGEITKLGDSETAGRPTHKLKVIPAASEESAYDHLLFHIDQQTCVPLEIEFFEVGDTPRKRLTADPESLKQLGERWITTRITMRDLKQNTHTLMETIDVEYDESINDAVFNFRGFYLGAYLEKSQKKDDIIGFLNVR